jgi:hypothetical protein
MKHGVVRRLFVPKAIRRFLAWFKGCDLVPTQLCQVIDLVRNMCGISANQSSGADRLLQRVANWQLMCRDDLASVMLKRRQGSGERGRIVSPFHRVAFSGLPQRLGHA